MGIFGDIFGGGGDGTTPTDQNTLQQRLNDLDEIIDSGATEVVVDGVTVKFQDRQELVRIRHRLSERLLTLQSADTKRPRASQIDLSGF